MTQVFFLNNDFSLVSELYCSSLSSDNAISHIQITDTKVISCDYVSLSSFPQLLKNEQASPLVTGSKKDFFQILNDNQGRVFNCTLVFL